MAEPRTVGAAAREQALREEEERWLNSAGDRTARTVGTGPSGKRADGKTGTSAEPELEPLPEDIAWPPGGASAPAYPAWAESLIADGWINRAEFDDAIARGMDVSTFAGWEAAKGRLDEEAAMGARDQARNDQFGNDMAWLDPEFQREAATVKPTTTADALQFGVTADPEALARQENLLESVLGRGATADSATETAQRGFLSELGSRGTTADPRAEAAQRELLGELGGREGTSDAESEQAQQYALDELFGLYRQGGQGAQDRAARARNRADSENWLKGQREADIQDRAERGMSGSGGEILDLLADRQAAASRLSAGDLEADAAAEQRAMDALLSGTQLATGMRSASDAYEAENTRARAGVADSMRTAADAYQGANDRMRGQTMEGMRSAADQFSVNNDRTASDLASRMRDSSDRFVGDNADRLGDSAEFNAKMINDAADAGKRFLQDAYTDTMRRRDTWDRELLGLQADVATGTRTHDASQNTQGWNQGTDLATADARATNSAQDAYNAGEMDTWLGGSGRALSDAQRNNQAWSDAMGGVGEYMGEVGKTVASAVGGGMGGGAMGGMGAMGGGAQGGSSAPRRDDDIVDPWGQW